MHIQYRFSRLATCTCITFFFKEGKSHTNFCARQLDIFNLPFLYRASPTSHLERIQRVAMSFIKDFRHQPYDERLIVFRRFAPNQKGLEDPKTNVGYKTLIY